MEELLKRAEAGDAEAQFEVYKAYFYGNGVEKNSNIAEKWLYKAAENNHPRALFTCGMLAKYIESNNESAFDYFDRAFKAGDMEAGFQFAMMLLDDTGNDPDAMGTGFNMIKIFAEQENAPSEVIYEFARCYMFGKGVEADYNIAINLFKKIFNRGSNEEYYTKSAHMLSLIYMTTKQHEEGRPYLEIAAKSGIPDAEYMMGLYYEAVEDLRQAEYWLREAANNGQEDAVKKLNSLKSNISNTTTTSVSQTSSSGGCYVATAVYGSYDCPEVWTLRRFRDYTLAETWYGMAFIKLYYAVSPTLVKWFGNTKWFNRIFRGILDKMVRELYSKGVENTPYEDKKF